MIKEQEAGMPTTDVCQVSYGEFLSCNNRQKFFSINAKRADFVVYDTRFRVLAVVEYQGDGHYGRTFLAKLTPKGATNRKTDASSARSKGLMI